MRNRQRKEAKKARLESFQKMIREKYIDGDDFDLYTREIDELDRRKLFNQVEEITESFERPTGSFLIELEMIKGDDAYFIYVGFCRDDKQFNNILLLIAEKLDYNMVTLFQESSVLELKKEDVFPEMIEIPDLYFSGVIEERVKMREDKERVEDLFEDFSDYVFSTPKEKIHVEDVDYLDAETLFAKLRANKPKEAQTFQYLKKNEEDWHDLKNVTYETFLYAGFSDGEDMIGDVMAFKVQYFADDVYKSSVRSVSALEETTDEKNRSRVDKRYYGKIVKRVSFFRFVEQMPREKVHFENVEILDVEKLFEILKIYQTGEIHIGRRIGEDSSHLYVALVENDTYCDIISINTKSLNWDVNAMFDEYKAEDEFSVKVEDLLSVPVHDYVLNLPWNNRPRESYSFNKNK